MKAKIYLGTLIALALFLGVYHVIFAVNPKDSAGFWKELVPLFFQSKSKAEADTLEKAEIFRLASTSDVVPIRSGFPFCETFIGFDPRPNAIWDGTLSSGAKNPNVKLTGNSLQLTSDGMNENGYVFVDIPFSSAFGLKVSFEFSSWGGDGADGFSFFMFDGSIDAGTFEIGGTGGALGYTPVRFPSDTDLVADGLKGAYLGIGFDELGNFGNSRDGKNGGMEDPSDGPNTPNRPLFKHSVVVRGPSDGDPAVPLRDRDRNNAWKSGIPLSGPRWDSYKFIDGRIFDPTSTGFYQVDGPLVLADATKYLHSERMELDTDAFSASCPDEGFRKVFIDLNPIDVNDRSKGYTIEVQMLVNVGGVVKLINVFNGPINFDFAAPELLKVGFAASTGSQTNFHEIRNVTVQVSNEDELVEPFVGPITEELCAGESNTFELDVELKNDVNNAFIRCIQLYYSEQEAEDVLTAGGTSIPFPPSGNINDLCPTGNCVDVLCLPERTKRIAYDSADPSKIAGEFEVFVELEGGVEVPKVRFIAEPGYSGQTTIYYTVTDNFGQISKPELITIDIIPQPMPVITTLDPLVWELQEASNIRVLLNSNITDPANDYQWFRNGTPIPGEKGISYLATEPGDYSISVILPQGCIGESDQPITIRIVGDLNPNFLDDPKPETCSELGSIQVDLNDLAVTGIASNGSPGNEKWKIVTSGGELVQDWTFLAAGQSEIVFSGLTSGDYILYIGDEYRSGQPGSDGNPLYRHQIPFTVTSNQTPLQIESSVINPELCFGSGGEIIINVSGGDGPGSYSFNVVNQSTGISFAPSTTSGGQAIFSSLPQGVYDIEVKSSAFCLLTDQATITGPSSALNLILVDYMGISCGVSDSGSIHWRAEGGTGPYTFVSLERNGVVVPNPTFTQAAGDFEFTNLIEGEYTLKIKDANDCEIVSSIVLLEVQPAPVFDAADVIICEGEIANLQPQIIELSNADPAFTWKNHKGTPITSNATIDGVTYSFVDDGDAATPLELTVSGLSPGTYDFTMSIAGTNTCDQPDQIVTITVNPLPVISKIEKLDASCFQQLDGRLEVVLDPAFNLTDHTYELVGVTGPQDSNVFENLPPGLYEIKVVNKSSNCEIVSDTIEITEPELLEISMLDFQDPSCDTANGSLTFSVIGGTPAYSILINGNPLSDFTYTETGGTYDVQSIGPGTYEIEVFDAKSCSAKVDSKIILTNQPLDPLSVSIDELEICEGNDATFVPSVNTVGDYTLTWYKDVDATQEIKTSTTPDSNGFIYSIDATTGVLIVGGITSGDYVFYLKVIGPNLCDRPAFPAKVKVFDALEATLNISDETCFNAGDGRIEVIATGADGKYEYSLNGGSFTSNPIFQNLTPGDYSFVVRSQNGCTFSINGIVEEVASPIATNTPDQIRASCDLPNGSLENLVISGGWGGYTVKWTKDSPNGPAVTGDSKGAYDLFPGDYFLTVTDLKGCTEVFQFNLEASSDPEYTLVPSLEVCEGERVEIRPVHLQPSPSLPPASFTEVRWYKNPNQTDLIENGPDPLNPTINYTIDDTDWLNPKLIVDGLPPGVHQFYFFVVCTGVELSSEIEIFQIPEVEFDVIPESCLNAADGKIKVVKGSNPNYVYSIDGGPDITQSALEAQLFAPGKYSIVVSQLGVGCPSSPVEVEILKPNLALEFDQINTLDPVCGIKNGEIEGSVLGGWQGYEVNLLSGNTKIASLTTTDGSFEFNGLAPGDYSIEAIDNRGCRIISNLVVLVQGPTRIEVEDIEICEGDLAEFIPQLDPVTPGAIISWYFDAAKSQPILSSASPAADGNIYQIDSNGILTVSGLKFTDGPKTYYSDVSGPGICPGFTASPKVTIKEIPVLDVKVDRVLCFGEKGKITLSATAGNGSFEFSLDGVNFQNSGVFDVPSGIYTGYVRSGSCLVSISDIDVLGPIEPLAGISTLVTNPACNDSNGELGFTISGGYGSAYELKLLKEGTVFKTETLNGPNILFENLPVGNYQLTVSDNYCEITLPPVQLSGIPTSVFANDDEICEGDSVSFVPTTSQSGVSPVWNWFKDSNGTQPILNGQSQDGISYSISSNGTLTVSGLKASLDPYSFYLGISGNNICPPELFEVKATVHAIPNLRVSNPSIVCDPTQTVDLTEFIEGFNPAVFDYKIYNPNGAAMQLSESESVSLTGDYRVSSAFKGLDCWSREQKIRVIVSDAELIPEFRYEADLGGGVMLNDAEVQILEDIRFMDQSQGKIIIWNWDFGDGNSSVQQNPTHQYEKVGTYTVKLTTIDEFGCMAEIQKLVVAKDDYLIIIPNAFTPDGTKNEFFAPQYRGIVEMEFYIFSTWGELLFSSNSMESIGWDGSYNGKPAIPGNYVYKGVFKTKSGQKIEKAGTFILIR